MSNDLISREDLKKKINSFYDSQYEGLVSSDLIKYAQAVDDYIDNAPTIEERPKGKWGDVFHEQGFNYRPCSNCKMEILESAFDNFCPNCGADMRGDV